VPNPALLPVHRLTRILGAVSRSAGARGLAYESPRGAPELRGQIAQRMLDAGCALTPDDVLITDGCTEALGLALRVVCEPGDTVAIESPAYFGLLEILRSLGLRALPLPSHPETGVHLDTLRFALSQMPIKACLLQTTFSNPLGSSMPDEAKEALVALLAEREVPLVEDDIYGDLSFRAGRPCAAKAFDRSGGVILCSSFSKTVSPGYRIGWIAAGRYQPAVERLKMVNTLASATLPQLALAEFLARGGYDHHLRRMRREYAQNRTCMVQAVNQYFPTGTRTSQPEGGQVLWVELPQAVDAMALAERALAHDIALAPGPMFSASGEYGHHVRLNFATWSPRVEHALLTLGRLAAELMDEGARSQ
jgi:DNA-binding transcriptional MocR family regulator